MIIGFQEHELQGWKSSLLNYQVDKKTKLLSQQGPPKAIRQVFKSKPASTTNTVMQSYVSSSLQPKETIKTPTKQYDAHNKYYSILQKYQKPYDIITHHPISLSMIELEPINTNKIRAPIRNLHNIINGSPIPEQHLKDRVIVLPPHHQKKQIKDNREYDIVNNQYKNNNDYRKTVQQQNNKSRIMQNYNKKHVYDKIYSRFYNPEQERQYWQQKHQNDRRLAQQNFDLKFPPSYQVRERFVQDATKPLPDGLIKFKQKLENSKRHHQLVHIKEDEYKKRNLESEGKDQRRSINRIHRTDGIKQNKSQISALLTYAKQDNNIKGIGFKQK